MSQRSKSLTLARVEDLTLGAFASVPNSPAFARFITIVSSSGNKDKFLAVVQYALKLVAQYLCWRAQIQHRAGRRAVPTSPAGLTIAKLAGIISDARLIQSITGIPAMVHWLISIEHTNPKSRALRTIRRSQAWSLLLYYPLEHLSYLLNHELIPKELSLPLPVAAERLDAKARGLSVKLDAGKLTRASMPLWGIYTALQLVVLLKDREEMLAKERSLHKTTSSGSIAAERAAIKRQKQVFKCEIIAQLCNLPLAAHWATSTGFIKSELVVNLLNFVSNAAGFTSLWLTASPPVVESPESEIDEKEVAGYSVAEPEAVEPPVGLDAPLGEL